MFVTSSRAVLFLVVCGAAGVLMSATAEGGADNKDICVMTDVLVAMKTLLIMLSKEIRDLRGQVKNSCQPGELPANHTDDTHEEDTTYQELNGILEGVDLVLNTTTTTLEPFLDYDNETDYDYENPVDSLVDGISSWWQSVSLFAPKPTGSTAAPDTNTTEEPSVTSTSDTGDQPTKPPQKLTTTTTTTTTTELPYSLPPIPTSCPNPFRLEAESCYLILHDQRDWKSWGEAHSVCQSYGGELAAPWRLASLQQYLSRYYSDAFWVGAKFTPTNRAWKWLSGRKVQQNEWKPGQPNRNPGKKCIFLDKWSGYRGNNYFCGEKYPFICEHRAS